MRFFSVLKVNLNMSEKEFAFACLTRVEQSRIQWAQNTETRDTATASTAQQLNRIEQLMNTREKWL